MPTVSEFYGILIRLYWRDIDRHSAPHFHARYAEHEASFSIPDAEVLVGGLPRKQRRSSRRGPNSTLTNWNRRGVGP